METIKDFLNDVTFITWALIIMGLYLSVFLHKVLSIIKEMRGLK